MCFFCNPDLTESKQHNLTSCLTLLGQILVFFFCLISRLLVGRPSVSVFPVLRAVPIFTFFFEGHGSGLPLVAPDKPGHGLLSWMCVFTQQVRFPCSMFVRSNVCQIQLFRSCLLLKNIPHISQRLLCFHCHPNLAETEQRNPTSF